VRISVGSLRAIRYMGRVRGWRLERLARIAAGWLIVLGACTSEGLVPPDAAALPEPEVLVRDACAPTAIALGADSVFWIASCDDRGQDSPRSIRRVARDGGAVDIGSILAADEPGAAMLAADAEHVYWARLLDGADGELVRLPHAGGEPEVIAIDQRQMYEALAQQLVVDDTRLYRSMFFDILAMPKDGSEPQQVFARGHAGPFLAPDADHLYWSSIRSVHRRAKASAAATDELVAETTSPIAMPLALTDTDVYFWATSLWRVDKAAVGTATLVRPGPAPSSNTAFTADASHVYWHDPTRGIVRTDRDGALMVVARRHAAKLLVVDADFLYWVESGSLVRVSKPSGGRDGRDAM
jgi:hypothetical protein